MRMMCDIAKTADFGEAVVVRAGIIGGVFPTRGLRV
jgi:hypothetical protein